MEESMSNQSSGDFDPTNSLPVDQEGESLASTLRKRLTRRDLLKFGAGIAGLAALSGCAPSAQPAAAPTKAPAAPTAAPAAAGPATAAPAVVSTPGSSFDWKRYKGETINALLVVASYTDVRKAHLSEFEDLTGIKVNADIVPEQQQRQKQIIEFTSGNPSFDVTDESWHVTKGLFGKGKWLLDLRDLIKDPNQTSPDFDFADFTEGSVKYATQADGRLDTIPLAVDQWILYWNKELFAKKNLKVPTTLDEMVSAAKELNDPANRIAGFVGRGLKNANTPVWTCFMQGWDVESIDSKNVMHTNGPEAIAAAQVYQTLLSKYAPPGVNGFNWMECQSSFEQGAAAMWFDGIGFTAPLEDPSKSRVVGKVGYALQPAGPKAQYSGMFGNGIGITATTKKVGPAWYFCQWYTQKKFNVEMLKTGAGSPVRKSAYQDQTALSQLKVPKEWVTTLLESQKIGKPSLPSIIPVTEFRDTFGIALTNMINGADPKSELDKATEQFKPILEKSLSS
jgi:multiple sugar transport system substrate-binding protein